MQRFLLKLFARKMLATPSMVMSLRIFLCYLGTFTLVHVKRSGNQVDHHLARHSKSGCELQVWFDSIPKDIAPLVVYDAL